MRFVVLFLPASALVLLGAHYARGGELGVAVAHVLLAVFLFSKRAWVRPVAAGILVLGSVEWVNAFVDLVRFRLAADIPWSRATIIMGMVLALNVLALFSLMCRGARDFYSRHRENIGWRAAMFFVVIIVLVFIRAKTAIPLLLADRFFPGWGGLETFALGLYAVWIGGKMLDPQQNRRARPRIWAFFSIVFFSQLVLGLAGVERMLMTGDLHLPVPALIVAGPVFRGGGVFMLALFSATVFLVGPAWCSHLCYIGALDDFMSRRGGKAGQNKKFERLGVWGRGATLVLVLGAAVILRQQDVSWLVAVWAAAVFGLIGIGIMFVFSRRAGLMVHCTTFCPMGLLAVVFGRLSLWRIRIDTNCSRCSACFSHCRYNALSEEAMVAGQPGMNCTLCGDCVAACPGGHVAYSFPFLNSVNSRALFLTLVISLHAVFLGVARM
ncbi:4Fe-4S binding protein [Pseudodesulfovibrio senegalensis]|uniref:4Fe-4S binding protein n=1 Tax=Pseudodesulfovibrio senegalensis TaxID=1721087 RepID=A0A6N6N2A0_9BACT|nr:4Fe-4S binding protein [Pseudodesulfovibrio senegalensis]KAB1441126.1 4Fe-4S binding protein [Pseudodesulfovibrio senegalensis]